MVILVFLRAKVHQPYIVYYYFYIYKTPYIFMYLINSPIYLKRYLYMVYIVFYMIQYK